MVFVKDHIKRFLEPQAGWIISSFLVPTLADSFRSLPAHLKSGSLLFLTRQPFQHITVIYVSRLH